ncbi:hypothetical protein Terro_1311 [Terriglobus roseus DSM 18391]|uniref:Uncharacterized protein n=1 Tax=Terriglobus roseus (strain DSM 18391 / NRRL B-41598 / KBS 63) TaxID=926566 RepID=I3ZEF2_TERRK|nr:hypothetical protein [Terriglobus roseus]AFL87620.1 hypothetical protein Terro_1311 [Terriglobus roseus DSM 18391]
MSRIHLALALLITLPAVAQTERHRLPVPGMDAPKPVPGAPTPKKPGGAKGITEPDDPEHPTPAARDFHDAKYRLSFHVPAGWNFERRDGVLSNFGVDVRTTKRTLDVRGVASINFNPYPVSTFSGATFYYSVMPNATAASCAAQAMTAPLKPQSDVRVGGLPFKHGRDENGHVCTESRDEVFTALQGRSCLRFDLVVNTFCSQTSGAMEISKDQLADVQGRLGKILDSLKVESK